MIVLHSLWDSFSERLYLWSETTEPPVKGRRNRAKPGAVTGLGPAGSGAAGRLAANGNRRRDQESLAQIHPFALPADRLKEATGNLWGGILDAEPGAISLLLPSTLEGPLPSPQLLQQQAEPDSAKKRLAAWDIPVLGFNGVAGLDFLAALPAESPQGIVYGAPLRFWAEAAKLALELIARESFAPTILGNKPEGPGFFRAVWQPVIDGKDSERVRMLAEAMPPLCRALVPPQGKDPANSTQLLTSFIHSAVDGFVRRSLSSVLPSRGPRSSLSWPERWLRGLFSQDAVMGMNKGEAEVFAGQVTSWVSRLQAVATDAAFRTCFRLEPPEDSGSDWKVSYLLQATDDKSLLVPAAGIWGTRSAVVSFLKRRFENPQERLLADLGRASRTYPAIDSSLTAACPECLTLSTDQAYDFLRQYAVPLEQSGFGVLLPPWWQKPSQRLSARLRIKPLPGTKVTKSGFFGADSLVAYDWEIALGDEALTKGEFEKLVHLKMPLVQVRGQWVELKPREIEAAIAFFKKKHGAGEMTLAEAFRVGLGRETSETGLPVAGIEAEGWPRDCLEGVQDGARIAEVVVPRAFQGELRPYQLKGLSWLLFMERFGLGACLADDMGLGKTIQLIALLLQERDSRSPRPGPTLLICPMSVAGNWQKEVQRFAPSLKVMVHHGADRLGERAFEREAKKHDLVVSTYALAARDRETFARVQWGRIALDEAQNIKNPEAKQTRAVRQLKAGRRIALTGTPVENRLSELWSIMDFLNPGYLGPAKEFHTNYAAPIEKFHDQSRAGDLKRLIQPFVLRRLKTDRSIIRDLPEKMEMKVFCNLTREQATLYEAVVQEMMARIEEAENIRRRGMVLAALSKLKQVCNHPAHFLQDGSPLPGRSGKLARLQEMLEEVVAAGDKALVFTQFAEFGARLQGYLQETLGKETLFLHGGTSKNQRDAMVQRFQSDAEGPRLFVLSLKAGGLGINLTAANHVFHFDRWWNPAVENQATDRAFRIGQHKNVQVHKFVCLGTLEEQIDAMIEKKKELAEGIIGTGEAWLTEMSTEELRKIFTLSREAVGDE